MFFDFNQNSELLTPTVTSGVNQVNPLITSSDLFLLDDNDLFFSSLLSNKNQDPLTNEENTNEIVDDIQEDDLFPTFDFPVLNELNKSDDTLSIDKYINESSFPSPTSDILNDTTFSPVDETTTNTNTNIWVGNECVVDLISDDMTVPSSPSSVSSVSSKKTFKKKGLSPVEKKLRKKNQNKTAAEKYRLKKRTERNELVTRHLQLQNQNKELKFELENFTFRLNHFKQLFIDLLKIPIPSNQSN